MSWEEYEGDETFTPPLPPEDRLWRHPAEVANHLRAPLPATTAIATVKTPLRQAVFLASAGAACGAIIVAGLFLSIGTPMRSPGNGDRVVQSFALDPYVPRPRIVDADEWPAAVAESNERAVVSVTASHGTRVDEGSAIVFRSDGLLLTSASLVDGAHGILVRLPDGGAATAEVIGADAISGLAVVAVDRSDLPTAHLGIFKRTAEIGQPAVVLTGEHTPADLQMTSITGMSVPVALTGTRRLHGMVQLEGGLPSRGDGSALLDDSGAVIGVNLDVGARNATYAVPIGFARKVAEDIVRHGEAHHSWLGIKGLDLDDHDAEALGLDGGVRLQVVLDGPAALAGMTNGDVLVSVDDQPVPSMTDLILALRERAPGTTLSVGYLHDGQRHTCTVTLGSTPSR